MGAIWLATSIGRADRAPRGSNGAFAAARKVNMANSATSRPSLVAPWRIGIDVGGTFTDLVLIDSAGTSLVIKVASVPADPSRAVIAALDRLADAIDKPQDIQPICETVPAQLVIRASCGSAGGSAGER